MTTQRVSKPKGDCPDCGPWGYCSAHRKPMSRMEWLTWCCWRGGMQQQQIAYSLGLGVSTVISYKARFRFKGWREPW